MDLLRNSMAVLVLASAVKNLDDLGFKVPKPGILETFISKQMNLQEYWGFSKTC